MELMVSIFIVALLTGLFLVNYKNTNKRSELNTVKQRLASDIRQAQNNSLGAKTYDGVHNPAGGWGAHFALAAPGSYIIFADKDGNHYYDSGEMIETRTLPPGVTISSLSPANFVDIVFLPPDPQTYINAASNAAASAQITLRESVNNSTALITVNFFGLIDTP